MKELTDPPNYAAAYAELQTIVRELQEETVDLDELPRKIARATELIRYCREHLRQTEDQVRQLTGA